MSEITFVDETHQYFNSKGEELISASTLVHKFTVPFDPKGEIIANCAKKRGTTIEQLRRDWDYERDSACERGHKFHKEAENWIKTGQIQEGEYKDVVEQLIKFDLKGKLIPERIVFNNSLKLAGCIDLTQDFGNQILSLKDYKTNKALKKKSFYRKGMGYEMMLYPVQHLQDSIWNRYQLQCSAYQLIEEENGYWVEGVELFYINPKTRIIERHPTQYLRQEILDMIDIYYGRKIKEQPKPIQNNDDFGF